MCRWRVDQVAHPRVPLLVVVDEDDDALIFVGWGGRPSSLARHAARHGATLSPERRASTPAKRQLLEYLAARRTRFDLPLRMLGTPFQMEAWRALCDIPYGETSSYGRQAAALGRPAASRAVGRANGTNPISIVVPCHRVIGTSGALTGFGGGLPTKRWLLQLERAHQAPSWNPSNPPAEDQLGLFA